MPDVRLIHNYCTAFALLSGVSSRIRDDRIRKHFTPFTDVADTGQDHRSLMFSSVEQVEDFLCHFANHRDYTPVINDPEFRAQYPFLKTHRQGLRSQVQGGFCRHRAGLGILLPGYLQ